MSPRQFKSFDTASSVASSEINLLLTRLIESAMLISLRATKELDPLQCQLRTVRLPMNGLRTIPAREVVVLKRPREYLRGGKDLMRPRGWRREGRKIGKSSDFHGKDAT